MQPVRTGRYIYHYLTDMIFRCKIHVSTIGKHRTCLIKTVIVRSGSVGAGCHNLKDSVPYIKDKNLKQVLDKNIETL
jgi:hypothetical protein